jgi:hypothetical protein
LFLTCRHDAPDLTAKVILHWHQIVIHKAAVIELLAHEDLSTDAHVQQFLLGTSMR